MRLPDGKTRLPCLAVIFLLALAAPGLAEASTPDPQALEVDVYELDRFYFQPDPPNAPHREIEPPSWLELAPGEAEGLVWQDPVRTLPGRRRYDLSEEPRKTYWWNYPLYGLLGFPRDLVDGFFGAVSKVGGLNILVTGIFYEVVPMQVLMRDWRDWHRWPGRANKQGHGWIDAPEGWGFFSKYRHTKFRPVNDKRLAAWQAHNEAIDRDVARRNREIEEVNAHVAERREAFMEKTRTAYKRRDYRNTVARLWAYLGADPRDREAKAMLIASLVAVSPNLAERAWGEAALRHQLRTSPQSVLVAAKEELREMAKRHPETEEIPYYLVWVCTRLRAYGEAYTEAGRLLARDPGNVLWQRLRFEAALRTGDKQWIASALSALESATGAGSVASLHGRGRWAFLRGHYTTAREIYKRLASQRESDARFYYYYGMALVHEGMETGLYDKRGAVRALESAAELAETKGRRLEYRKAARAADELRVKPPR